MLLFFNPKQIKDYIPLYQTSKITHKYRDLRDPKSLVFTLCVQHLQCWHQLYLLISVETAAELKSLLCYWSLAPLTCTVGSPSSPSSLFLAWSNPIHTNRPLPLTCRNWTYKDWLISMYREDLEVKTPETIITCNAGGLWLKSLSPPSALLWNLLLLELGGRRIRPLLGIGNIDKILVA